MREHGEWDVCVAGPGLRDVEQEQSFTLWLLVSGFHTTCELALPKYRDAVALPLGFLLSS